MGVHTPSYAIAILRLWNHLPQMDCIVFLYQFFLKLQDHSFGRIFYNTLNPPTPTLSRIVPLQQMSQPQVHIHLTLLLSTNSELMFLLLHTNHICNLAKQTSFGRRSLCLLHILFCHVLHCLVYMYCKAEMK